MTAKIEGYKAVDKQGENVFVSQNDILARTPYYNLAELLKEAERQFDDRTLSKAEKKLYHIE